jgi:hypothetical protein
LTCGYLMNTVKMTVEGTMNVAYMAWRQTVSIRSITMN